LGPTRVVKTIGLSLGGIQWLWQISTEDGENKGVETGLSQQRASYRDSIKTRQNRGVHFGMSGIFDGETRQSSVFIKNFKLRINTSQPAKIELITCMQTMPLQNRK
jgi:hypothetical protein